MNKIELALKQALIASAKINWDITLVESDVVIEIPKDASHGDYATNLAMRLTKEVKQNPRLVAESLIAKLDRDASNVEEATIAGPGFINFRINKTSLANVIGTILNADTTYGQNNVGNNERVNVEYVSANPTGDLHLGHARGAAWGDSVTRLMRASGFDTTREFYVNDAGNQVNNLAISLYARYLQSFGREATLPEDGYWGKDVVNIAEQIKAEHGDAWLDVEEAAWFAFFKKEGIRLELQKLQRDLDFFRVHFDVWTSEQTLHDDGKVAAAIEALREKGELFEEGGALWFQSTKYGDDKDRVLRKSDGSYTYLVPDIAYHINKFERGFTKLVNFWGADHHGYIPRMKASLQALGYPKDALAVDIIQMVRLVEDGNEVKMSKRTGNAVTVRELCEEVGVDAVRYFFVSRAVDTHFDFDLGVARKQSNDNPVYYAQYAHARICSILRQCDVPTATSYELLTHEKEVALLKYMNELPSVVGDAAMTRAPHKVCNYIQKLAAHFHSFYASCKVNDPDNVALSAQRVALLQATRITLRNALDLIGVEAIEKM
ncbi:MAG: arginine--tRNA ligase [Erysipelotrichaceae bacterium]